MTQTQSFSIKDLENIARQAKDKGEQAEYVDVNVRKLANQLKCMTLAMVTASRVTGGGEGMSKLMSTMLNKASEDTNKLLKAVDIPPDQAPDWLGNQIRGILLDVVASGVKLNVGAAARMDATDYMQPIIDLVKSDTSFGTAQYDSPDVGFATRKGMALAKAAASVMSAYESHNYYHPEARPVAEMVTNYLRARVYEETLSELVDIYQLNNAEADYIGNTLMHHAGELLTNSWAKCVPEVHDSVMEMSADERRAVMARGFPLDIVFQDFDNHFEGMKLSVMTSFEHTMAERVQPAQKKTNEQGLNSASTGQSPSFG